MLVVIGCVPNSAARTDSTVTILATFDRFEMSAAAGTTGKSERIATKSKKQGGGTPPMHY